MLKLDYKVIDNFTKGNMRKKQNLTILQIKSLSVVAGFLLLTAFGVGTVNYIENNSYLLNQAKAADSSATDPVNPGGGGTIIPKPSSTSSTGSTTSSTSTTGSSTSTSGSTSSTTSGSSSSGSTTTSSTSTPSTTSGTGSTSSNSGSSSSSSSTPGTSSTTDNKTPGTLPGGGGDVLVINKNNSTVTSSYTAAQNSSSTQTTTSTAVPNSSLNATVRTGGVEVTLATITVVAFAGFVYYYKTHGSKKGGLKTAEKKIK